MKWGELKALSTDAQAAYLVTLHRFREMPEHYMADWLNACDERGLSIRQAVGALMDAMGMVGTDLD